MRELRRTKAVGYRSLPTMRRLIAGLTVVAIATMATPATAADVGQIVGRVVNETTGEPQPRVEVTLTTGTESGESEVVGTMATDAKGRYSFEGLATGEDRFYALDASYDGGTFAGRPISLPSDTNKEPVIRSTLRVWETTTEPGVMAIRRDDMFVVANEQGVGVIEAVTFVNTSDMAYIGRGAAMLGENASGASFVFALPNGASEFNPIDSTLDIPTMTDADQGVAATIAIPPGENRTTFSYRLEGSGGSFDLSRPALYPILEMSIFAGDPLEIRSNRLTSRGDVDIEGTTYERWSADQAIDAGDPVQVLAVAGGNVPVVPLVAGGAALAIVIGLIVLLVRRRTPPDQTPRSSRTELLERVAVLDLALEAGDIERPDWDRQRAELMDELRSMQAQS
jgi:Carboxypeptidase regulatory-like domain